MKRNSSLILLILSVLLVTCNRQTRYFRNMEVHGKLLHYYTKAPLEGVTITLKADDVHSASSYDVGAIVLESCVTKADGSFELKSRASKKDRYYLQIEGKNHINANTSSDTSFNASAGKQVDIGNLYTGEHVFCYKMRLVSTSGNCAWVNTDGDYMNFIKIRAGADTSVTYHMTRSYYSLVKTGNKLFYNIYKGSCISKDMAVPGNEQFPVSFTDTIRLQQNF